MKGKLWTPTRPDFGEGSTDQESSRYVHLDRSTGVMDTARRAGDLASGGSCKRGIPVPDEGSRLNGGEGHWFEREADRGVVPSKPGHAGGGKAPDFWDVFEANEVR